jgi:carbon monoxide dehydrogenase subunit G
MDMTGERRIPAPRQKVWAALNDPAVLKASIPGCESLEKTSDTDLKATASVKIGPIAARFTGKVQLLDLDPPNSYRIEGEGAGGVAGFAKGGAVVRLADDGADTLLTYDVKAQVGGKIAQLGARLIDATAKQMADLFFNNFVAQVAAGEAAPVAVAPATIASADPLLAGTPAPILPSMPLPPAPPAAISVFALIPKEPYGFPIVAWIGGALFLVIFIMIFSAYL